MSRRTTWLMVATTLVITIAAASEALAADRFQKLAGPQIRARIAGMEVSDDVHWAEVYEAIGVVTSYSMGKTRLGKWRTEENLLCVVFEDSDDCFEVWVAGPKVQFRHEGWWPDRAWASAGARRCRRGPLAAGQGSE